MLKKMRQSRSIKIYNKKSMRQSREKSFPQYSLFFFLSVHSLRMTYRASLVAQWLRICLLMQGTRVRALVWKDPTCRRATGPVSHNYWATITEPARLEPVLRNKRGHDSERPAPLATIRESPRTETKTQHSHK